MRAGRRRAKLNVRDKSRAVCVCHPEFFSMYAVVRKEENVFADGGQLARFRKIRARRYVGDEPRSRIGSIGSPDFIARARTVRSEVNQISDGRERARIGRA